MNTPSNAMPESFDAHRVVPASLSVTRPMYWSVRRELWENRSIYIGTRRSSAKRWPCRTTS